MFKDPEKDNSITRNHFFWKKNQTSIGFVIQLHHFYQAKFQSIIKCLTFA